MLDGKLRWYYRPGERLPTEGELAEYFQVSRPTIRKALLALENLGRVRSRQGSGWFAADQGPRHTGKTVVIICEDVAGQSPWFVQSREMRQLVGMQRTLSKAGYDVCVRLVNDRLRESAGDWAKVRWPDLLDFRTLCGLLVFWRFGHRRLHVLDILREYAPLVAGGAGTAPGRGEASLDVASGVFQSFSHLLDRGHRGIAFVGSGPGSTINQQRHIAMQLVGRSLPGGGVLLTPLFEARTVDRAEGARLADAVLDDPEPPTAAHVAARELGEGFYQRLSERGVRVPEDFSLVVEAEDGLPFETLPPDTTRVKFDYEKLGDRSAELLIEIMQDPFSKHGVEPLPTSFTLGSTTAHLGGIEGVDDGPQVDSLPLRSD